MPWPSGYRCFGFGFDGSIVVAEAEAIREAAEAALAGESMKSIARRWTVAGFNSAHGTTGWTGRGVRSLLLNPRLAGRATYRGAEVGRGLWEPIISEHTATLLKAKLTAPGRLSGTGKGGRVPENLLTGLARCQRCEATVQAGSTNGKRSYVCQRGCVSTPRHQADLYLSAVVALSLARVQETLRVVRRPVETDALEAEERILRAREQLESLALAFAAGSVTIEQLEAASAELRGQIEDGERELIDRETAPASAQDVVDLWVSGELRARRAFIAQTLDVELVPRGRGRRNVPIHDQVKVWIKAEDGSREPIELG
jgi:hypothetical protein